MNVFVKKLSPYTAKLIIILIGAKISHFFCFKCFEYLNVQPSLNFLFTLKEIILCHLKKYEWLKHSQRTYKILSTFINKNIKLNIDGLRDEKFFFFTQISWSTLVLCVKMHNFFQLCYHFIDRSIPILQIKVPDSVLYLVRKCCMEIFCKTKKKPYVDICWLFVLNMFKLFILPMFLSFFYDTHFMYSHWYSVFLNEHPIYIYRMRKLFENINYKLDITLW